MALPHLLEELRAVPFTVEDDHEACPMAIGHKLLCGGLAGNLLEQARHDVAFEHLQQPMVDRPFDREERLAQDVVDPVVGGPSQAESLS